MSDIDYVNAATFSIDKAAETDSPYVQHFHAARAQTMATLEVAEQLSEVHAMKERELYEARTANLIALYSATENESLLAIIEARIGIELR